MIGTTLHNRYRPDAGVLNGGRITLGGGFWRGGVVISRPNRIHLPSVVCRPR